MLVLSRKPGESIIIGDGIELTVVEVKGNRIRLGIQAPKETPIRRAEIQLDTTPYEEGPHDRSTPTEICPAA